MSAQGIDFGGYTIWDRAAIQGKRVDFVVCGVAWGKHINSTWKENKREIAQEYRRLLYTFWNNGTNPIEQADVVLREAKDVNAHAIFVDWERSRYGVREDLDMRPQARSLKTELDYLIDKFRGQVGVYANFNDYMLANRYVDLSPYPLWIADPDGNRLNEPGNAWWWRQIKRKDYAFDQWDWKGYAPDYGAINDKKSMDLTQFNGTIAELDEWLGIKPKTISLRYINRLMRKLAIWRRAI